MHFNFFNKSNYNDLSIDDIVERIKAGDKKLKNLFITDYQSFIIGSVSRVCGRFIDLKNSDEFSIGLSAFSEAIDCFSKEKNNSFFAFADQVIRRRVIDYIRKSQRQNHILPFTYFETEPNEKFEEKYLQTNTTHFSENIEIREELSSFIHELLEYGISLEELILNGPKHCDSIKSCIEIAKIIVDNPTLYKKMEAKKTLPLSLLTLNVKVHKRTLERNRKFIIAMVLILKSNLSVLKWYMKKAEERGCK